ncbi:FAD-dependent monooxygenase [Labedaea rhizosphaerae]|uniref:2-polyprenyl-6-methoxyphenol hydroxylase-like FAD-dependent oxidoreductase n=1 Tax=Labedaea rhizosphaerae TaxID=598644 RepID=A0A4R6SLW2_LABRH|nr:NAD(P)/FAD-dependent oxidoreductase [Labedaea rhizosphaerae]TDQ05476.1 2-polyprenyl-6-methoxyphenol hydroxylase-like FAD-dependent oxidoreductase [Labedaea rhizosphaerae]
MRAVVIGGGVAGSACAAALTRIGWDATVYESYPDPAGPVGSFLSLATNGLRGLEALGCLPAVRAAGFAVPWQQMWSGRGKSLGRVPRARPADSARHSITLLRADLVTALREHAGVAIHTGRTWDGSGDPDLVVGADGIWSPTRSAIDPGAPKPRYGGMFSVAGTSDVDLEPGTFHMTYGRHATFIHVPLPTGQVWWSAQIPGDAADLTLDEVADLLEPRLADIVRATTHKHGWTPHHVLDPVRRQHDGRRTVIIGDAAHPVGSGQGASMAIEDAVVLAQQLRRHGTVAEALAEYDRLRRDRLDKLAKMAARNRDAKLAGPVASRVRDVVMPLVFPRVYPKATNWLYDFEPGAPLTPAVPEAIG